MSKQAISDPITLRARNKTEALAAIKKAGKVSLWFVFGGSGQYIRVSKRQAALTIKNADCDAFEVIWNALGNVYICEGELS